MWAGANHGEHVCFGDVFDGHGDSVFPSAQGFVVGCSNETAVVVDKSNCVDCCQVMVIFLNKLARTCIELNNFLVGHASQKLVRVFGVRVETDNVRCLSSGKARNAFAVLGIPEFHLTVIRGSKKSFPRGVEIRIANGLGVARKGTQEFALVVDVPDLGLSIGRRRQKQMARFGEEIKRRDGFRV